MMLSYLVVADVDPASVRDDNPPEAVAPAFESEIHSWLDSLTCVFGLREVRVERADTKIRDSSKLLNVLLLDCFEPMIEPLLGADPAFSPVAILRCRHCARRGAINGGTETIQHETWCVVGQIAEIVSPRG